MAERAQKKQKVPSRKAMAGRAKDERRAIETSDVKWEQFITGTLPEANVRAGLKLGIVKGVKGGSRFTVETLDGELYEGVTIKTSVKVGSHKRAAESAAFIGVGTYVLTDGDTISAKVQTNEARKYITRMGMGAAVPPPMPGSGSSRGTRRSGSGSSRGSRGSTGTHRSGRGAGSANSNNNHGNAPEGFAWNLSNARGRPGAIARLASRKAKRAAAMAEQGAIRAAQQANYVRNLFNEDPRREYALVAAKLPREGPKHVEKFGYRIPKGENTGVLEFFERRMAAAANPAGGVGGNE